MANEKLDLSKKSEDENKTLGADVSKLSDFVDVLEKNISDLLELVKNSKSPDDYKKAHGLYCSIHNTLSNPAQADLLASPVSGDASFRLISQLNKFMRIMSAFSFISFANTTEDFDTEFSTNLSLMKSSAKN